MMYYAFNVGDGVQAVMVLAENANLFKEIAKETSPAFEQIQVISSSQPSRPAVTQPSRPENQSGTPSTSFFQQTGPASDQFVSGVVTAQSAELKPVSFRVTGGMRFGTLSASDSDMVMSARDKDGNLYIIESSVGVFGSTDRAQFIHRIKDFSAPQKLDWSRKAAMINVNRLSKEKVDLFFADVSPIHTLRVDEKGNLYVGINIDHDNAFFSLERGGESKLLASMSQLSRAANGYQTGGTASRLYVSQSGSAWLMVQGVEKPGGKDYGTNAFFLERADGGWKAVPIPVRCQGQPCSQKTKYTIFANGTVDADGGWIFYDGAGFWRATKDGDVRQLARLKLPTGDVTITGPVVLANGDIWYAFSTDYSVVTGGTVNQQTGYYDARNTWFTVGDRSRLVRIRIKDGAVQLGEISSEKILAALRAQKLPLRPDSQVMKTVRLVPDYSTGGLLVFDGHHSVLYGIQPQD